MEESQAIQRKVLEDRDKEVHLVVRLLQRSCRDLAVEAFMTRVFLSIPKYLKACSLVCSEWKEFIQRNVWGLHSSRKYLENKLMRNWELGVPIQQYELESNLPLDIRTLACDDEILLVGGADKVAVFSLLPPHLVATLELGDETGGEEEIKFAVTNNFLVTVQTVTRKLQVWTKECSLQDSVDIWDLSVRAVTADGDTVILVGSAAGGWMFGSRGVVLVYRMEGHTLKHRYTMTMEHGLGTTRAVGCQEDTGVLVTGHDQLSIVWDLQTGEQRRNIHTGLVVQLVLKDKVLVTVGSLQNLGVKLWCITTGSLLAEHNPTAYYESLVLGRGQIFARGLECDRIIVDLSCVAPGTELPWQRWLKFSSLMAANSTKLVVVKTQLFPMDSGLPVQRKSTVSVKDFWSKS